MSARKKSCRELAAKRNRTHANGLGLGQANLRRVSLRRLQIASASLDKSQVEILSGLVDDFAAREVRAGRLVLPSDCAFTAQ